MRFFQFIGVSYFEVWHMDMKTVIKNNKGTINNVRKFFKRGETYEHYLNIVSATAGLSSVNYKNQPSKTNYTDRMEKLYLRAIRAKKIVDSVQEAIQALPEKRLQIIMHDAFIDNEVSYNIYTRIHIERSQYFVLLDYGLYLFADVFLMRQLINGVPDPIDLHADDDAC